MIKIPETMPSLERCAWDSIVDGWSKLSHLDLEQRCHETSRRTVGEIVEFLNSKKLLATLKHLEDYQTRTATVLNRLYRECRDRFLLVQETPNYLGSDSKRIYTYVRNHIGIALHRGFSEPIPLQTKLLGLRRPILTSLSLANI